MAEADNSLVTRLRKALGSSYTIEGEIGRGGMGVVYQARDERLKRQVAIKVLPPELAFREEIRIRFLREAETAARLSHPHIVPIHSVGEGPDGLVYFVMAYVDGESLAARLKRRDRLPAEEARRVMIETADALGAAHAVGIIHRDVKPDNILLEGSRGRVVVTDFGIAKALSSTTGSATLTATGVAIGTPHYMSPEQAAGDREIDGRSDLYSLGVVSYQTLPAEPPRARRAPRPAGRGRRSGHRAGGARQFRAVGLGEWVTAPGRCPHGPSRAQLVVDGRGLHGRVRSRAALHQALACRLLLARRVVPAVRTRRGRCPSRSRHRCEAGGAPARHERRVRAPDGRGPAGSQ